MDKDPLAAVVHANAAAALAEDVGSGDLTASLIGEDVLASASIIAREHATLAGQPWVDEVFRQLDRDIQIDWYVADGETVDKDDIVCKLVGNARALLTGERAALNFLQTLSATATQTAAFAQAIADTDCRVLDTRKTLPGLRQAQKYAVRMGGGTNHRSGLYDAILIKENHIRSAGSITAAIDHAQQQSPDVLIEVEVENNDELREALHAGIARVLLDNYTLSDLAAAVAINRDEFSRQAELEASGNVELSTLRDIALTGVDYISTGAITKHVRAVDLSMLFGA